MQGNLRMDSCSPRYLNITVNFDDPDSVWQLLQEVKPNWNSKNLERKPFSNGVINQMMCYYQKADEHMADAIVIRVYNIRIGDTARREREFLIAQIAHAAGCFPRIYGSFNNGFLYRYAVGKKPNFHDITKPEFIWNFARKLHAFHSCEVTKLPLKNLHGMPATYEPYSVTIEGRGMANIIPENPDPSLDAISVTKFHLYRREFTRDYFIQEYKYIQGVLDDISLPVSLSHLDLHPQNMVLDPATGDITFLDFELSGHQYPYYDLVFFLSIRSFLAKMGAFSPDEPAFTDEHCMRFLREYLHAKYEGQGIDVMSIPQEEFDLIGIQLKIIDVLINLQFISTFLALSSELKMAHLLDHIPDFKDKYLAGKKELPVLLDSCKQLMKKLSQNDAGDI